MSAKFDLSSANLLNSDQSKSLSFGKELTLSQMTIFRLFQAVRDYGRQFQTGQKCHQVLQIGRKH